MTSNHYVIDTCSLIALNRHNPLDVFPSVWNKLESLISRGQLVAPKEVLNELGHQDDMVAAWAKKQKKLFVEPTEKQIEIVKQVLAKYPGLVKIDRQYDADPFVIALTVELTKSKQQTLIPVKRIVVTEEKLRGNKIRIPLICKDYDVECIDVIELFRTEGWKF
ncbi:MAG: DUF4411 family protein [Nanoarchaeota archaeon]|nr:DUF4411 family protein [Nanoarchaeota archaeon]